MLLQYLCVNCFFSLMLSLVAVFSLVAVSGVRFCPGWQELSASCFCFLCTRYNREWRYHKEERIWLTRVPGTKLAKMEATFEEGTYFYFDVNSWRKAHKELRVEYEKLEDRPQVPQALSAQMVSSLPVNSWCVFKVICVWKCINSVQDCTHLLSWDDFPMKDFHCFMRASASIYKQHLGRTLQEPYMIPFLSKDVRNYRSYMDILLVERLLYYRRCLFSGSELHARYDWWVMAPSAHRSLSPTSHTAYKY